MAKYKNVFLVVFHASLHFHGYLPRYFWLPWCLFYLKVTFTFKFLSSIWALNAKSKKWSSSTSTTCDIVTYRAGAFAQLKIDKFTSAVNISYQSQRIFDKCIISWLLSIHSLYSKLTLLTGRKPQLYTWQCHRPWWSHGNWGGYLFIFGSYSLEM